MKTTTRKMNFTYEPIALTKLLLQMYTEKYLEKEIEVNATIFACYDFLKTATDKEIETLLHEFVKNENIDVITFEDWEHDCKCIFDCIFNTQRFKKLEFDYKVKGHSKSGLGVADKSDSTFYSCSLAEHWVTIQNILQEKYPLYYDAFIEMTYGHENVQEHKGISRQELDSFILTNFQLVGESKNINSYVNTEG